MDSMDVDGPPDVISQPSAQQGSVSSNIRTPPPATSTRESFREISVKVHMRRPGKDSWAYLGRGTVSQECIDGASRICVRSVSDGKVWVSFDERTDLLAEKRGNFVVLGLVHDGRVCSWSLNALNNSETLRLLTIIELACYKCRQSVTDPSKHTKFRKKIEKVIKDDRKRRHRRRKEQEALINAFASSKLDDHLAPPAGPPDSQQPQLQASIE
jgi:hypothetical protein